MKRYFLVLFCILILAVFFVIAKVFAVDQIKSVEFYVADSDVPISSQLNQQFSVYIGDNLAGITNPIKSVYFIVSGVATSSGAGSLEFKIDSDSNTSKVFSLPDVSSAPTPFELIYKDNSNKINPSSAGTYNYTLNIIPSGITISGLGVKVIITYRYAPISCPDGQPSDEKIKTNEFFVIDSDSQISSQLNGSFNFYIGDNLSGITNPIKSVYFIVSGVATSSGAGSLEFKIDSDSNTSKTFTLPDVATTPTPFELIYKDNSNKINPTSAGTYNYTLNIIPSGITISGLGVKLVETHRYKPPTCGGGTYRATGDIISPVFDTGAANGVGYNFITLRGQIPWPSNTKVRVRLATATVDTGPWSYIGPDCTDSTYYWDSIMLSAEETKEIKCYSNHNNKRYFRYKVTLCSDSASNCQNGGADTPIINDVIINWSP